MFFFKQICNLKELKFIFFVKFLLLKLVSNLIEIFKTSTIIFLLETVVIFFEFFSPEKILQQQQFFLLIRLLFCVKETVRYRGVTAPHLAPTFSTVRRLANIPGEILPLSGGRRRSRPSARRCSWPSPRQSRWAWWRRRPACRRWLELFLSFPPAKNGLNWLRNWVG